MCKHTIIAMLISITCTIASSLARGEISDEAKHDVRDYISYYHCNDVNTVKEECGNYDECFMLIKEHNGKYFARCGREAIAIRSLNGYWNHYNDIVDLMGKCLTIREDGVRRGTIITDDETQMRETDDPWPCEALLRKYLKDYAMGEKGEYLSENQYMQRLRHVADLYIDARLQNQEEAFAILSTAIALSLNEDLANRMIRIALHDRGIADNGYLFSSEKEKRQSSYPYIAIKKRFADEDGLNKLAYERQMQYYMDNNILIHRLLRGGEIITERVKKDASGQFITEEVEPFPLSPWLIGGTVGLAIPGALFLYVALKKRRSKQEKVQRNNSYQIAY